jgi:hypothetical protein
MLLPSAARTMMRTTTNTVDTSANPITVHPPPEVGDAPWLFASPWWFGDVVGGRCFMSTLDDARKSGWAAFVLGIQALGLMMHAILAEQLLSSATK